MKFKCQCCDFEQEFTSTEVAFEAGWDTPPRFSYTTCDLCPGICVFMNLPHDKAHALWAKEGRPKEFSMLTCGIDDDIGDQKKSDNFDASYEQFKAADDATKADMVESLLNPRRGKDG